MHGADFTGPDPSQAFPKMIDVDVNQSSAITQSGLEPTETKWRPGPPSVLNKNRKISLGSLGW